MYLGYDGRDIYARIKSGKTWAVYSKRPQMVVKVTMGREGCYGS